MNKVEDHLRCPICFEIPSSEIYQCVNGHHICSECDRVLFECPTCRCNFTSPRIRNRAMETILDSTSFDCVYANKGCTEKLPRTRVRSHPNECKFRPFHFCKIIGFGNCDFDANQIPRLTIAHLQRAHNIIARQTSSAEICLVNFDQATSSSKTTGNRFWSPVLIKLDEDDYHTFLFMGTLQNDGLFSCACLYMKDSEKDASSFQVQFSIRNVLGMGQESEFKWTVTPATFKKIDELLKNPRFTIPMAFFKNHAQAHIYENGGGLKMNLQITKRTGKREFGTTVTSINVFLR